MFADRVTERSAELFVYSKDAGSGYITAARSWRRLFACIRGPEGL